MGEIGTGGKFCVEPSCTIEAHKDKERKMNDKPQVVSESESYVFIALSDTTLLKNWCLPVETFVNIEPYITMTRTWTEWEVLFRELGQRAAAANGAVDTDEMEEVVRVVKRLGEHISLMPEGPSKKLKTDAIRDRVSAKYPRPLLIRADPEDEDWVTHANSIVKEVNQLRVEVTNNEMMYEEGDLPNIHLHLSAIGNVMGARDEFTDPRTIMDHLNFLGASTEALSENASLADVRVENLEKSSLVIKELEKTSLNAEECEGVKILFNKFDPKLALSELKVGIVAGVKTYLSPLTTWTNSWSTSKGLMKGLDEKMEAFEKKLSKLASDAISAGASGMSSGTMGRGTNPLQQAFGSLGLGVNSMAGGGTSTPAPMPGGLEVRLKVMEEELRSLKVGTKSVSIVGQEFSSKMAVAAWMKINCPNDQGYLFCVDVHSLLAMAFTGKDMQEQVQMEVMSKKANYRSPEHMWVTKSFGSKIPEVLTNGKALSDPKMLAAMPTFGDFDGGMPHTGFRHNFLERITDYAPQINTCVYDNFSPGGASVALACVSEAVNFLNQLMVWMSQTHSELQKVSPTGSADNWKYVCHCVRVVFEVLHDARRSGSGKMEDKAGTMWGCLQGIREARNILSKGFSAHPVVANVLNIHMQKRSMMRGEHTQIQETTNKSITALKEEVRRQATEVARLNSEVTKLKMKK